ncbi:hypothetical protein ACTSEF_002910 [Escherichia albertii]|uniref:hypothetical protein n=1 Tax=Escherichia albertii TaxID=208962 RepID=UPI0012307245|nr:hypothetical protein [Escherichia albertii]EFO0322269.1 hypothetical protein [Escherichia albertii]HEB0991096.1 hypothetical protein [Escherichia albertii]HEB0995641.1 hypothetical protein [Escherichia albertii]HEB1000201.1 hypothetical protein [Escherichia albertii]HEB1004783.1 hypothetical protein [Escherichia albertii]
MNTSPMQIMIDEMTAAMMQSLDGAASAINLDRMRDVMDNKNFKDFIQTIEIDEPRMILNVDDVNLKRFITTETNKFSVSPERLIKTAVTLQFLGVNE